MNRRSDHHGGNVRRGRGDVRCLDSGSLATVEPDTRSLIGTAVWISPH
jgi:hypothetical protein